MEERSVNHKILIMAGGTGGHVFPALSIARQLLSRGARVEWLGTRKGLEAKVVKDAAIPLHFISIAGLRGKSILKQIIAPALIAGAILQALMKVLRIRPRCVLGMGGFATGPGGVAAWILGRKLVIHEQNAIAGLTNQLLFPLAATVMEAFPGAFERKRSLSRSRLLAALIKPERVILVGNPVREEILQEREAARAEGGPAEPEQEANPEAMPQPAMAERHLAKLPSAAESRSAAENAAPPARLLILGGSAGAVAINQIIPAMLALMPASARPKVLHQCGRANLEETAASYARHGLEPSADLRIEPFLGDMAGAYGWADLVICRAGALTVSEIASVGVASILIPYPYAVDDHQTENAALLVKAGAAQLIQQRDMTPQSLLELVNGYLLGGRQKLTESALAARALGRPEATAKAASLCLEACHA